MSVFRGLIMFHINLLKLKTVNDTAERAVKLMQNLHSLLTVEEKINITKKI